MAILGWKAGSEQYPPMELLDYAVAAEEAGFDCINVSDHFHPWSEEGQAPFTWTWLGAAAVKTKRSMVGTGLTCPILRYHPAIIAQAAATLACMAPGRTFLGLGTGEALNEYSSTAEWPGYDVRQAMLREAIVLMRELWTGEEISFDGDFYATRKARLYTLPEQPVPIYISSKVPASAGFAGEMGDGLMTTGGQEPAAYKKIIAAFEHGARDAGRDPASLPKTIELSVAYTDNMEGAIEGSKKYWAGTFIPALYTQKIYTPKQSAENGKVIEADAVRKHGCFSSDPEQHVQFAQQYLDLGFDQLYFHCPGPDQKDFVQRYGKDVLPRLRRESAEAPAGRQQKGNGK